MCVHQPFMVVTPGCTSGGVALPQDSPVQFTTSLEVKIQLTSCSGSARMEVSYVYYEVKS